MYDKLGVEGWIRSMAVVVKKKKKKAASKRFILKADQWEADIAVQCGGSFQSHVKWFAKKCGREPIEIPDKTSRYANSLFYDDFKGCAVWFADSQPGGGAVAHEVFHIAHHVLSRSGITLTDESEEAYAYFISWMVGAIGRRVW